MHSVVLNEAVRLLVFTLTRCGSLRRRLTFSSKSAMIGEFSAVCLCNSCSDPGQQLPPPKPRRNAASAAGSGGCVPETRIGRFIAQFAVGERQLFLQRWTAATGTRELLEPTRSR